MTSTPNTVVMALTMTFPAAPLPPPPMNSTVGGPQNTGPTLQSFLKASEKSAFSAMLERVSPILVTPSTAFWTNEAASLALLTIENKSRVGDFSAPLTGFHSLTSEHLGSSSQVKNERASVANPITLSRAPVAAPIPASKDLIGAITELIAESIRPLILPSNEPMKFWVAHGGVVINLSIIWSRNPPTILVRFFIIFLNKHANSSLAISTFTFSSGNSVGKTLLNWSLKTSLTFFSAFFWISAVILLTSPAIALVALSFTLAISFSILSILVDTFVSQSLAVFCILFTSASIFFISLCIPTTGDGSHLLIVGMFLGLLSFLYCSLVAPSFLPTKEAGDSITSLLLVLLRLPVLPWPPLRLGLIVSGTASASSWVVPKAFLGTVSSTVYPLKGENGVSGTFFITAVYWLYPITPMMIGIWASSPSMKKPYTKLPCLNWGVCTAPPDVPAVTGSITDAQGKSSSVKSPGAAVWYPMILTLYLKSKPFCFLVVLVGVAGKLPAHLLWSTTWPIHHMNPSFPRKWVFINPCSSISRHILYTLMSLDDYHNILLGDHHYVSHASH